MTPFMKEQLEKSGLFTVDVSTTPPAPRRGSRKERDPGAAGRAREEDGRAPGAVGEVAPKFKDYKVVLSNYNGEHWPAT
jgi:hypothetical protein